MKAILVIDMPQNCGVCPIAEYILFENGKARVDAGGNCPIENNYIADDKWNERPSWCPLKPMQQKKVVTVKRIEDIQSYSITEVADKISAKIILKTNEVFALGWNACIDAIIGDTDGTKGEITGEIDESNTCDRDA